MPKVEQRLRVFVNHESVEIDGDHISAVELLRKASFEGEEWDLMRLNGKRDPSGGKPIDQESLLELTNDEHFRVIPGNRTFG